MYSTTKAQGLVINKDESWQELKIEVGDGSLDFTSY